MRDLQLVLLALLGLVAAAHPKLVRRSPNRHRAIISNNTSLHSFDKRGLFSGRATYFYQGLGACGWYSTDNQAVVALSENIWNTGMVDDNPNNNKYCGKPIWITYGGKTVEAKVVDLCPVDGGCTSSDGDALDLSPSLFQSFTGLGTGIFWMKWSWSPPDTGPSPEEQAASASASASAAAAASSSKAAQWAAEQSSISVASVASVASIKSVAKQSSLSAAAYASSQSAKSASLASASALSVVQVRGALQSTPTSRATSTSQSADEPGPTSNSNLKKSNVQRVNQVLLNLANLLGTAVSIADSQ